MADSYRSEQRADRSWLARDRWPKTTAADAYIRYTILSSCVVAGCVLHYTACSNNCWYQIKLTLWTHKKPATQHRYISKQVSKQESHYIYICRRPNSRTNAKMAPDDTILYIFNAFKHQLRAGLVEHVMQTNPAREEFIFHTFVNSKPWLC